MKLWLGLLLALPLLLGLVDSAALAAESPDLVLRGG